MFGDLVERNVSLTASLVMVGARLGRWCIVHTTPRTSRGRGFGCSGDGAVGSCFRVVIERGPSSSVVLRVCTVRDWGNRG